MPKKSLSQLLPLLAVIIFTANCGGNSTPSGSDVNPPEGKPRSVREETDPRPNEALLAKAEAFRKEIKSSGITAANIETLLRQWAQEDNESKDSGPLHGSLSKELSEAVATLETAKDQIEAFATSDAPLDACNVEKAVKEITNVKDFAHLKSAGEEMVKLIREDKDYFYNGINGQIDPKDLIGGCSGHKAWQFDDSREPSQYRNGFKKYMQALVAFGQPDSDT
ncbi:MAG: hypothetical protein ROO73_02080 [Roseivirga sp.]